MLALSSNFVLVRLYLTYNNTNYHILASLNNRYKTKDEIVFPSRGQVEDWLVSQPYRQASVVSIVLMLTSSALARSHGARVIMATICKQTVYRRRNDWCFNSSAIL